MPGRPNVVWICADDFTPQACGAYGSPVARTPNLNRLAAGGVTFDRAFATAPLSTPSRQSFFTGKYPRTIGVTLTPTPLPADEVTLPARLMAAGYHTAAFGKTHFYAPRPSDYHTRVDRGEYHDWLTARGGYSVPPSRDVLGPWAPFGDPARVWLNADVKPFGGLDEEMVGTFYASRAAEFIRSRPAEPYFCYVSFYETHSPFWFPADWPFRHSTDEFAAPDVTVSDLAELPEVFRELTPADRRGIIAAYHTCASFMDKNVGLVLDAITDAGGWGDTLVIFTSDHGYLLGQHGRFEKHCSYDPAVQACLIAKPPSAPRTGVRSSALVSLFDLFPTVLEYSGVPVPEGVQAKTLVPLLNGETATHRDHVIAEYCDNTEVMVRTERWKYVCSAGARLRRDGYATADDPRRWAKLFDLMNDPDELNDLSADAGCDDVRRELTELLLEHLLSTDRFPDRLAGAAELDSLLAAALSPPERW
jgi:choline-sulfatase